MFYFISINHLLKNIMVMDIKKYETLVRNLTREIRIARHQDEIDRHIYFWAKNVVFATIINTSINTIDDDMLDILDALKDALEDDHCIKDSYDMHFINSIYDSIKEYYFDVD